MTRVSAAHIIGAYEFPERRIDNRSVPEIAAHVARGALLDAGLTLADVDGFFTSGDAPGFGTVALAEYLGLTGLKHIDSTDTGGSSYAMHVGHAVEAIVAGTCSVALITMAGLGRQFAPELPGPEFPFEGALGLTQPMNYALSARHHMSKFGTTSRQLAEIKVAASLHAQHNPHALRREVVTVDEVVESPLIADPLHRLDCCITSDGGGALVVVAPHVARSLGRRSVKVLAHAETVKHGGYGRFDLETTSAAVTGPRAFDLARVTPSDVDYVSLYDSFTITVLLSLEDLGFCAKGEGGKFVASGALRSPDGALPFNTDGGGLCSNHPGRRGGMVRTIEAVRQLRGDAAAAVQVPDCEIALVQTHGGGLSTRAGGATLILGREDV